MKADRANILSEFICHNGPQYVIPVYQRNYTWDERNISKLLSDIKRIIDNDNKITHFIGNIVYVITDTINIIQERAIVDGQQRLTTIFLALYALRDLAIAAGDEDTAFDIISIYLENNVRQAEYKNKLKPLVNDDDVLQQIVCQNFDEINKSKSLIYENYKYIKLEFKTWIASGASIKKIIAAINQLIIVWVQLGQDDDAQQIFESINSTGESLSAPDLIRNFILMNKKDDIQTRLYNTYWLKIEKNVVPSELRVIKRKQ